MRLRAIPKGTIASTDLELMDEAIPTPADGQIVVKNSVASIDPTHRIWMNGQKQQYMDAVQIGEVMRAATVGVITDSKHDDWPVGTRVVGFGGICDYYLGIPGMNVMEKCVQQPQSCDDTEKENDTDTDMSLFELSYGSLIIGLTAWHGVNKILEPGYTGSIKDEVIVISGGAGAVGSIAGQLCKLKGATVIGIAGGPEKCRFMTETLGYDFAIDYKASSSGKPSSIGDKLKEYAPNGVTGYYDNVGGIATESVLENARNNMKMAVCGSISEYDDQWEGIKNFNMILMRRINITGFICTDHMDELGAARTELKKLKQEGQLVVLEDVREGIEHYVDVVNLLFTGGNKGKLMLRM